MAKINIDLCGMKLKNPIMPAAGPNVKDGEMCKKSIEGGAGAVVTKTISLLPADVPRPCMAEIKGGFLNTELWSELSKEQWVEKEYKIAKEAGEPVIISMGYTEEQIREVAPLVKPFADAVELSTHYVGTDVTPIVRALKAAKEVLDVPVFMKMSPHTDIQKIAKAVEEAGADGLLMMNSYGPCMGIDVKTGYPIMGSQKGYGWLSGAAIKPIAVRCIYDVAQVVDIPIIGVGGVTNGLDAAEMIMAGASAVQVCTEAILKGPGVYGKIAEELNDFLDEYGYDDVAQIKGLTHKKMADRNFRTHSIPAYVDNDKCISCGICKKLCPYEAITIEDKLVIDEEKCFGCGLCVSKCPKGALGISLK
ncbi:4Fe-4S binding protein [Tepidibacter hydrothermalis]|uniref:Dihydroorotate dehydrogenase B (NAD(+)), catalytic subunit n=1 Tax=Tepidibacter hydrothermalis TaxID=3036126 RepID=A0ABY8EH78_9FIRM|nr:4Fe-4S binding protein [Tepidibacter hydrothermalis]WFD12281.1 4Fe-4S binding protein [Tepidibacter hydrothermalis]